jgi:hypothetical protein
MAGLISLRAGPRSSPSLARSSSAWASPPASHVAVRLPSPLFRCAKLRRSRSLLAAALEISKDGSAAVLANSLPSQGSSSFFFFSGLEAGRNPARRMFKDSQPCGGPVSVPESLRRTVSDLPIARLHVYRGYRDVAECRCSMFRR